MKMRMIFTENAHGIHRMKSINGDYIFPEGSAFFFEFRDVDSGELSDLYRLAAESIFEISDRHHQKLLLRLLRPDLLFKSDFTDFSPAVRRELLRIKKFFTPQEKKAWPLKHGSLNWLSGPLVMGIVNVTPDSFSDGGRYFDPTAAMEHARRLIDEGSDVLDIGGESSRPGAEPVTAGEELRRVIPVIEGIRRFSDIPLSIDTYKSTVARAALDAGADIINDISGTEFDVQMAELVKEKRCPIVIMHMKGQPKTMQDAPEYREVVTEVYDYFEKKIKHLSSLNDGQIILDPGIGFGKRLEHNLSLIRQMRDFTFWGYPLLTGISRKSFLGEFLGLNVDERKHASKYVELITLMKGSSMIRTHDVREVVQIRKLFQALF